VRVSPVMKPLPDHFAKKEVGLKGKFPISVGVAADLSTELISIKLFKRRWKGCDKM